MCRKLYMLKVIPSNEELSQVHVAKEDPNLHLGTVVLVTWEWTMLQS